METAKVFDRDEVPDDVFKMFKFHVWHPVYMYEVGTFMGAAAGSKGLSKEQFAAVDDFFFKNGCEVDETVYIRERLY